MCVCVCVARNLTHGFALAKQVLYKALLFFLNRHKINVKGVLKVVFVSSVLRIGGDEAGESLV